MKRIIGITLSAAVLLTTPPLFGKEKKAPTGRAQLWEANCARCHNLRSPASYSDDQWDIILVHMRVRGTLTAEEAKAIKEFLQAGN